MMEHKKSGAFIGNHSIRHHGQKKLSSINPNNASTIAILDTCNQTDVQTTIDHAHQAYQEWAKVPAPVRAKVLNLLKLKIETHQLRLAKLISMEMGKIINEAKAEIQEILDMIDFAIGQSRMLYGKTMHSERPMHRIYEQWHPLGIIGIFTAFNFPMAVWAWNACLAIIGGNSVIWKPSSQTPLCAIAIHELCMDVMNELKTPNIFSLIITESHDAALPLLTSNQVKLVSFTGSCRQGKEIARLVHQRLGKTLLELGGNNAIIIDESANIDLALDHVYFGAIATSGQRCTSTRRVFIHQQHHDAFLTALRQRYQGIQIDDGLAPSCQLGPLINQTAIDNYINAIDAIKKAKGKIYFGGKIINRPGYFVEPTLVQDLNHDSAIVQQETFAPILYLFPFSNIQEAIRMQNDVPQGLSSALFTQNLSHAELFLSQKGSDCGIANINTSTAGAEICIAFGGEKETGGGREAGSDAWKNYMRRQSCVINWGTSFSLAQNLDF